MGFKWVYDMEVTDTFGGEPNYSWCQRFRVTAKSKRGAIIKLSKHIGTQGRLVRQYDTGDVVFHTVIGAAVGIFTMSKSDTDPFFRNAIEL